MFRDLGYRPLQAMARHRGIRPTGTKASLINRLEAQVSRRQMRATEHYNKSEADGQSQSEDDPKDKTKAKTEESKQGTLRQLCG